MSTQALIEQTREAYALSPQAAADRLGLCRASIYNLMARGEIRTVKIGRARRIPVTEVKRLAGLTEGNAS